MQLTDIFTIIISLLVGGGAGFFIAQRKFKNDLAKNPPVNEKMIRAMYMQMGRKPSEAQIRQTINGMNQYKK